MKMKTLKKAFTGRVATRGIARVVACVVACVLSVAISGGELQASSFQDAPAGPIYASQDGSPARGRPPAAPLAQQQLQQLVAPIALYPDALVAQILAASVYPTQVVEAERFLQQNPDLKGTDLATAVDQQDWDPSVKALTQFPSVLANLDKNLTWTSELGDANTNQPTEVMDAVQYMRHKAEAAGNLKTTPQQVVTEQGPDVVIQPADPQVVYVPTYDPTFIYGYPVGLWPGFYYPWWGPGAYLSFGVGFGVGAFFGFGWGWGGWGLNWGQRGIWYGGSRYAYHTRAFYNRNAYFHEGYNGGFRGGSPYASGSRGARGYAEQGDRGGAGSRPGAFGGVTRGGDARGYSSRGQSSFGGGGFHGGGGGGFHGGGGGGRH